jgi:hypothetical protein
MGTMKIKNRPMDMRGTKVERRLENRFEVNVPIEVSWRGEDGTVVKEEAIAQFANANGCFLRMSVYPDQGARLTLANFLSAQTADARVLATPQTRAGVANGVIVELIVPNEDFWGVDLALQKAIAELKALEKALKREEAHPRLLDEYQDAVKFIRAIAEAVQLQRTREIRGLDDSEVLTDIASDRVRRAVKICAELIGDFDAGWVKSQSKSIDELSRTIDDLHGRLKAAKR